MGNAEFNVPGRGTKANDIGITNFVALNTDIVAANGQYLLLVAVDENDYIKAFANILITVSNPGDAELIPGSCYTLTKGTTEGTTRFTSLMGLPGQEKWAYAILDTASTTPVKKEVDIKNIAGAKVFNWSEDIPIKYGQTILLLAVDKNNKVMGYAYISVSEDQIQAASASV